MITRLRNKALERLGVSFLLLVFAVVLLSLKRRGVPDAILAVGSITSVIFAFVLYVQGNIALAEAKGHDGSVVAAIVIVACLCLGGLFFAMPLIILFGLEDRNKVRSYSHAIEQELAPTKRNPPAKLPPLKHDSAA